METAAAACSALTAWWGDTRQDQANGLYNPFLNGVRNPYMPPDTNPPTAAMESRAISLAALAARQDQRWTPLAEAMVAWTQNSQMPDGTDAGTVLTDQCLIATGHRPY